MDVVDGVIVLLPVLVDERDTDIVLEAVVVTVAEAVGEVKD